MRADQLVVRSLQNASLVGSLCLSLLLYSNACESPAVLPSRACHVCATEGGRGQVDALNPWSCPARCLVSPHVSPTLAGNRRNSPAEHRSKHCVELGGDRGPWSARAPRNHFFGAWFSRLPVNLPHRNVSHLLCHVLGPRALVVSAQVVGINTAIHADGEGIGFAIPINSARRIVGSLIEGGVFYRSNEIDRIPFLSI